ncbi:MAG: hypothetical protein LBG77_00045 [Dysgonamonadaceae bacterium]|nr:hypothetical protein [Dysgonamonadaceae bacterium]
MTYNVDLQTGWNIIYGKVLSDNGDFELTSTKPDTELKWGAIWKKQEPQYGCSGIFTYTLAAEMPMAIKILE